MEIKGREPRPIERKVYGKTGEVGKDGILTPEQQLLLNRFQENAAESLMTYMDAMEGGGPYPIVAWATGLGKGRIIHLLLEKQIRKKPESKALLIAGTKLVLVKQSHKALGQYQEEAGSNGSNYVESEANDELNRDTTSVESPLEDQKSLLYRTGKLRDKKANVHIATIQSVQSEITRQMLNPGNYDFEIIDEVHNIGTFKRKEAVSKFKKAVGFTATPYRHSGEMKTPEHYGFTIIEFLSLSEAQQLRLLPPLLGIQVDTKGLVDEIPTTRIGTIDYAKLEKMLKNSPELRPFIADRVSKIITDGERKYKAIIVVNFVWEAQELAKLLAEKGIKVGIAVNQQASKSLHTEEIPAIGSIERYKLPEDDPKSVQVLISPYVASEGFDAPATEVLVWASPTDSELRYTQYTGRLARRNEGKLFGVVVDFLYQTSQYNWNFNMGMWMKEDVKQLENGMLWLGPETDIERLKNLPQVEAIRKQADIKPISNLQKEGLLEVQETDFLFTADNIGIFFIGGTNTRAQLVAKNVLQEIQKETPNMVINRRGNSSIVLVVLNKDVFIGKMVREGFKLRDANILPIEETDFSTSSLRKNFFGSSKSLKLSLERTLKRIRQEEPKLIVARRSGSGEIVEVVSDRGKFIKYMQEEGAMLKESEISKVKDTDFPINKPFLRGIFSGGYGKLKTIAEKVLQRIEIENPNLIVTRKTKGGSRRMTEQAVTDKDLFIRYMIEAGAQLKDLTIPGVSETDFPVSYNGLRSTFTGPWHKNKPIMEQTLRRIILEDPTLVVQKRTGTRLIRVVTDRKKFIKYMLENGATLRESK